MTINDFTKLNFSEKMSLIDTDAQLIDSYIDKNQEIMIYYIFDFFTEVTVNYKTQCITDVIPYKRGFKLNYETETVLLSA